MRDTDIDTVIEKDVTANALLKGE